VDVTACASLALPPSPVITTRKILGIGEGRLRLTGIGRAGAHQGGRHPWMNSSYVSCAVSRLVYWHFHTTLLTPGDDGENVLFLPPFWRSSITPWRVINASWLPLRAKATGRFGALRQLDRAGDSSDAFPLAEFDPSRYVSISPGGAHIKGTRQTLRFAGPVQICWRTRFAVLNQCDAVASIWSGLQEAACLGENKRNCFSRRPPGSRRPNILPNST